MDDWLKEKTETMTKNGFLADYIMLGNKGGCPGQHGLDKKSNKGKKGCTYSCVECWKKSFNSAEIVFKKDIEELEKRDSRKMEMYIDNPQKCKRCASYNECLEKEKFKMVSTEIQKVAEKYENIFHDTFTMIDFTCKSYWSKETGYDGDSETSGYC